MDIRFFEFQTQVLGLTFKNFEKRRSSNLHNYSHLKVFKTGRKDCKPDSNLPSDWIKSYQPTKSKPDDKVQRPYFSDRHETHPNPHGNGESTTGYFKKHFDMTAKESIALLEGTTIFF